MEIELASLLDRVNYSLPTNEFVVVPVLVQFLEYTPEMSPDLHLAAITEQMLLQTDMSSPGYDLLRHQLSYEAIAAIVTTKFSPLAVETFLELSKTYHIDEFLPEIPDQWLSYLAKHGNENPSAPHLNNQEPT